ncbi:cartilage intermediate layer protein 1 [Latimeria chalumnae]|uniref:Cartilage intermediate layer protein n=1 Tax=Latimeria chalumnae TaxID=7897 RepID=H3BAU3_LATCH|nr:PREDICTED: cartilage intermediate layer protein 1 [Latimeria chalumnae]|eukprot:XP_005990183.1 PREDICTED: cartilage intermediate layer protein 1 [Latimeria chalumnae]
MITVKWKIFFLLLLGVECASSQGSQNYDSVLSKSARRTRIGNNHHPNSYKKYSLENHWEWTTWFNIDHPEGNGDYERLDAIRFYYRERVCQSPVKVEARTTEWIPAEETGEMVHFSLEKGFWCLNNEQPGRRNCSNYSVRFLCPKDSSSAVVMGLWSSWTNWNECLASCDQLAVQKRTRTCLAAGPSWQRHCSGPQEEGRICRGPPCKVCNMTCLVGRVNAECDACMCEEHLLYGFVHLQDGAPAAGASIYLQAKSLKPVTVSDDSGRFRIPGVCPDGKTTLKVKKEKYATTSAIVPKSTSKISVIEIKLKRAEKPYIIKNPENKGRREGQSVTLCCQIVGKPSPDQYLWYHNGTLLDKQLYQYDNSLILRNLRMDQAGEYYCKASNNAGSIKSKAAKLTVIAQNQPSCNTKPENHLIRLPHDCFQNSTNSFYYDVGKCPSATCAGKLDDGLRCKDSVSHCCGVSKMEAREISCSQYDLPIMVVTKCGCQKCTEIKTIIRGRAVAVDNGEPMRFGHILLGKNRISMTGYKGAFSIQVPAETERLVLTFVDRLQKFVNTTKVLAFNKKGGAVYHEIKLLRKKKPVTFDSTVTNTISLGETEREHPIGKLEFPPNSFYNQNGAIYSGKVKASVTFLDPRNISVATAAQSDLNYVNEDGDVFPLRTYGMFSVHFTDESTSEILNAGQAKVYLDSTQVKMPEHLEKMKLWSLNPETGFWEEEGDLKFTKTKRGKREERTFLIGNMEIRERRLFNLDVPESRRCYVKVRAYRGDRFMPSEQVEGVVITLINMEPMAGFSSNPRAWGRFDSVITGSNGACLPAFCDNQRPDAYSAYVTATLGGEELEAVASAPKYNPNAIGVPQPYLNKLNYRRTDHEDPRVKKTAFNINMAKPSPNAAEESNGPIYAYEQLKECEEAPFSAAHFRFYRVEGNGYDYNTVPFNEDDPMTWNADYLAWWPKPMEFRACFIKIKINGPQEIMVRSRNMGGTHPVTSGRLYGIRDVRSTHDMDQPSVSAACLEFKCSGMLYDQERVDRTLVKVIPQGSCRRENVNSMLQEYLVNHLPLAVNNDTNEFSMLAPLDPLGHNYGIYTVTDQDPRTAKEIALGRCFDGTSDGSSRVMKTNVGVGLTFNCVEREVGRQSVFQTLQNSPGQSLLSSVRDRQINRRQQRRSSVRRNRILLTNLRRASRE